MALQKYRMIVDASKAQDVLKLLGTVSVIQDAADAGPDANMMHSRRIDFAAELPEGEVLNMDGIGSIFAMCLGATIHIRRI